MSKKYFGSIKSETCGICKFELREGQEILQCTYCSSLFHEGHLTEWFQKDNRCPVCKRPLDKESNANINKKGISLNASQDEIVVKHNLYGKNRDLIILSIVMSIISLIFFGLAAYFIYEIIATAQYWFEFLGGGIVIILFFFYGFGALSLGFKSTPFNIITFQKDIIKIERQKKPKIIEINPSNITKLELEMETYLTSTEKEKFYLTKINCNIFSTDRNLRLGHIFTSRDEFDARDFYKQLVDFISSFYGITPQDFIADKKKRKIIEAIFYIIILFVLPILALIFLALYFNVTKL